MPVAEDVLGSDELESRVRLYSRWFPRRFARAKGALLWDDGGKQYIDFLSGAGSLNYGHNPEPLKRALLEYIADDGIANSLDLHTVARQAFISGFNDLILRPRGLRYRMMLCGPTGANAVEAALKLARKITGRVNIAAFTNSFHGLSLGALAVTGERNKRRAAGAPLGLVDRMPFDGYLGSGTDTSRVIEKLLDDPGSGFDPPAAFILETVQGEGGLRVASSVWLQRIAAIAHRYGSLLILDDIQTGCGRTGTFFSFEGMGIEPDVICLSKSFSGYGLPLSVILLRPQIDVWEPGEHSGTFRGHNLAFVTGRAALDYWRDATFAELLSRNIGELDQWITRIVSQFLPLGLSPRGRGLIRGIACEQAVTARLTCEQAFKQGVILETSGPFGEVIKILPPLNIDTDLLREGLERLARAITTVGRRRRAAL